VLFDKIHQKNYLHTDKSSAGYLVMRISYNKLWKLMIDLNMNKTQLRREAGLSTNIIAKLSKNEAVSMDTILRICDALQCNVGDIIDAIIESEQLQISDYHFANDTNILKVAEKSNNVYKG